jgi:hypothetical protein
MKTKTPKQVPKKMLQKALFNHCPNSSTLARLSAAVLQALRLIGGSAGTEAFSFPSRADQLHFF